MYQVCWDTEWKIDKAESEVSAKSLKEEPLDQLQNGKKYSSGKRHSKIIGPKDKTSTRLVINPKVNNRGTWTESILKTVAVGLHHWATFCTSLNLPLVSSEATAFATMTRFLDRWRASGRNRMWSSHMCYLRSESKQPGDRRWLKSSISVSHSIRI